MGFPVRIQRGLSKDRYGVLMTASVTKLTGVWSVATMGPTLYGRVRVANGMWCPGGTMESLLAMRSLPISAAWVTFAGAVPAATTEADGETLKPIAAVLGTPCDRFRPRDVKLARCLRHSAWRIGHASAGCVE